MFLRLCGPPSIPLSFTVAGVLPRWDAYRFRSGTQGLNAPDTQHPSFTARTTRVSNPVRSRAFVPQRQWRHGTLPSQSGFCAISMHFTATPRIPHASAALKAPSSDGSAGLSPAISPPA